MTKIILDCDPGHDDAIAILLAAANPQIELLGITTVAGNQTLAKVTYNALSVCTAAGIKVPVAAGAAAPLVAPPIVASDIHGETGLDGPFLPEPAFAIDERRAADFIVETVMAHEPNSIHLVPVGPLTNIALAMRLEPKIIERVKSVMLMGGAYTRGNITPCAEFNIYVDPEAAEAVFAADWDVTMVGLDLTHQALATPELQRRVGEIGSDLAEFVLGIWDFVGSAYRDVFGFDSPPVHDACCVAALIDPLVFTTADADVRVELAGTLTRGQTVTNFVDTPGMTHSGGLSGESSVESTGSPRRPAKVAMQLDWDRFADWSSTASKPCRIDRPLRRRPRPPTRDSRADNPTSRQLADK